MNPPRRLAAGALSLACALALVTPAAAAPAKPKRASLTAAIGAKLQARRPLRPETHTTDFAGDSLGCITMTQWELRPFGYRGHAFVCEAAADGEVLGAVLNRFGEARCYITGSYAGDGCYDLVICGIPDAACVD